MSLLWRLFLEVYGSTPSLSSVSCQAGCFVFWRVFLNVAILSQTEASSQLVILKTLNFLNFSYGTFLASNSYYRRGRAASLLYEGSFRKAPRRVAVGGVLCFWGRPLRYFEYQLGWADGSKKNDTPLVFHALAGGVFAFQVALFPPINILTSPTG